VVVGIDQIPLSANVLCACAEWYRRRIFELRKAPVFGAKVETDIR
jgi:hypothetical protein